MNFEDFKHQISIQVRFSDIDRLDHVNNACYLNYFELGRVRYFNEVFRNAIDWEKRGFVLARTEIDHIEPIFLNDQVWCFTRIEKIGTKSLTVSNAVVKHSNNGPIVCARGKGVLVAMDYLKKESIELPQEWVKRIREYEDN